MFFFSQEEGEERSSKDFQGVVFFFLLTRLLKIPNIESGGKRFNGGEIYCLSIECFRVYSNCRFCILGV